MNITQMSVNITGVVFVVCFSSVVFATKLTLVTEHLAPFQIVDANSITGFSTEIVKAVLDESEYDYSIEAYPWSVSFNRARKEENICIFSLARIQSREPQFQWIGHITTSTISFYTLKNSPLTISNLDDAKKYKTAVIKDDVTHHFLVSKGFVEGDNLYVMSNYDALLELLETPSRQIDLIIINDDLINSRGENTTEKSKYLNVHMLDDLKLDFYLACSLNTDKSIVKTLSAVMKRQEILGLYIPVRNKWKKIMVNLIK